MNDTIRVLTVRQPWAWAIIHAGKDVENRSRSLGPYRGSVAIQASKHLPPRKEFEAAADRIAAVTGTRPLIVPPDQLGAIIGVVDLVASHAVDEVGCMAAIDICSPWADMEYGTHHLRFTNAFALDQPVPWTGGLGLRKSDLFISGDWLGIQHDSSCRTPCAGVYGCPPSCYSSPLARLEAIA